MKKLYLLTLLTCSLFTCACGSSTNLQLKVKDRAMTLKGSASYVSLSEVSPIGAAFTIANYEPKKVGGTTVAFDDVKADEQVRLFFTIRGGQSTNNKIEPGEYAVKAASRTPETSQVVVYYYEGGERYGQRNETLSDTEGKVTITSVTDDSISGTIDVGNGEKFVKGDFTAKLLKK